MSPPDFQAYFWVPQMPYETVDQLVINPLSLSCLKFLTGMCSDFFFLRMLNRPAARIYDHGFYLLLHYGIYSHDIFQIVHSPDYVASRRFLWERWWPTCPSQVDTSNWLNVLSTLPFLLLWDGIIGASRGPCCP